MKFINLETGEVFQSEYDVAPVVHGKWVMKQRGCSGKEAELSRFALYVAGRMRADTISAPRAARR